MYLFASSSFRVHQKNSVPADGGAFVCYEMLSLLVYNLYMQIIDMNYINLYVLCINPCVIELGIENPTFDRDQNEHGRQSVVIVPPRNRHHFDYEDNNGQ